MTKDKEPLIHLYKSKWFEGTWFENEFAIVACGRVVEKDFVTKNRKDVICKCCRKTKVFRGIV